MTGSDQRPPATDPATAETTLPVNDADHGLSEHSPWLTASGVAAVISRPHLWMTALRAAADLAPRGWWRRPPFLPIPDRRWLHFRLVTAYGGDGTTPMQQDDLVTWLEWKRDYPG